MKFFVSATIIALGLAAAAEPADAAGCLKGAAVGAGVGHLAGHHAVLGGVAGCAIGHHRATASSRQQQQVAPGQGGNVGNNGAGNGTNTPAP